MADIEKAVILKVGTSDSIKNIGDLRENIKELTKQLNGYDETVEGATRHVDGLKIGTDEYNKAVQQLNVNQNALRNAMNGTTASMDDVLKASNGVGQSYNALVARMKSLKQEIRNIDVSTEAGKQKFDDYARQIDEVNSQLKDMDEAMGSHVRNVGNYTSAFDNFGQVLSGLPPFMDKIKRGGENINKSMKILSANPIMGMLTLMAPLLVSIVKNLKESTTFTEAWDKAMKAFEPVGNAVNAIFEKLGALVGNVVEWFVALTAEYKDTFKVIIAGAVGVGNAILQFLLAPIRTSIEAFKGLGQVMKDVFTGNWKQIKDDAVAATSAINDAFLKGFDFKGAYKEGQKAADAFFDGAGSRKKKASKTGKDIAKEITVAISEELTLDDDPLKDYFEQLEKAAKERRKQLERDEKDADRILQNQLQWNALREDDEKKRAANAYEIQRAANEARLQLLREYQAEAEALEDYEGAGEAYREALQLEIDMEREAFAEKKRIREEDKKNAEENAKQRIDIMQGAMGALSKILGSVADAVEGEAEGNEKAAKRIKGLRISAAIIDTISGALAAYTSAQSLGVPMGPIMGAINAAAVTAAGIAEIAKIKSTKVGSGDGGSSPSVSLASIAAPAVAVNLPEVRNVTTATEEDRYERMAASNKVYILNSDLEANDEYHKVQIAEATF